MKLQTKSIKNGRNNDKWLIMYFDMDWLSIEELLDTPEGIKSGINIQVIRYRLKNKKKNKIETLEELLKPKQKYKYSKKSDTEMFSSCSSETIEILESGNNKDLLEHKGGRILKVRGKFRIPGLLKKPLITREIEIDEKKYNQSKNKEQFIKLSFMHHIADELEVDCVVLG